jgi:two-component sensor histidine kinase
MNNTLALLGAWLRLDLASAGSADFPEVIDQFEHRILGFGRLYDVLSNEPEDDVTSLAEYIERLCRALTAAILESTGTSVRMGDPTWCACLEPVPTAGSHHCGTGNQCSEARVPRP